MAPSHYFSLVSLLLLNFFLSHINLDCLANDLTSFKTVSIQKSNSLTTP